MKKETHKEDFKVQEVSLSDNLEGYHHVTTTDGIGFGIKAKYGVTPKVDDVITLYQLGGSFGTIRGMDINGVKLFYKTDEELEASRLKWLKENEERKQKEFVENVAEMDASYNALPKCFQDRIDKFRKNNPRFRVDLEPYELFCCEQAVLIANACKTVEAVAEFREKPWKEQIEQLPELSHEHSGNTFGASCVMAHWYLKHPESLMKMNGALAPLVGSAEYENPAEDPSN